ncbi:hypothetical protein MJG53_015935 [Ovis ammon polii x Ovis aries]|uniref:Uncharacterized protein n=3 Tax=Ovis TaxID=9935 RepID=A0A835ZTJ9_SHEEP|nr:hypothetical protein JEQ12_011898 [Ovis aries]KAI4532707.1 hypothetical protein MG293_017115 [Ovis ammon polii]KAI4564923.1 hypothetical protein MJG53_015935 [Ovis ammon polii x Ovis aries]
MKRSGAKAFPETNENAGVSLTLVNCHIFTCHNGTNLCPLVESTFVAALSKSMVVFKREDQVGVEGEWAPPHCDSTDHERHPIYSLITPLWSFTR